MNDEQNQPTLTDLWDVVQKQRQEMEAQRAEIAALTAHRRRRLLRRAIPRRGVMVATSLVLAVGLLTATPFTWIANGSTAASPLWSILGNAGTNASTNFLGTTDNQALVVKTNNAEAMRVLPGGNVGVGISTPAYKLDVSGDLNASGNLRENGTTLGNKYLKLDGTNAPSGGVPISITGNTGGNAAGFTGNLAGDVTGTQGATHVSKLQGNTLSATTPTSGQVLTYDGNQWAPASAHVGSLSVTVASNSGSVDCCADNYQDFYATCPSGSIVVGGGFQTTDDTQHIWRSLPHSSTQWQVRATDDLGPHNLGVFAMCLTFTP